MSLDDTNRERERRRQAITGDDRFFRQFLYMFELVQGGWRQTAARSSFFPLMLAPQQYSISEPFTVALTPTLGGGLFVEETGVLARTIRISGTTGFRPRKLQVSPGVHAHLAARNYPVRNVTQGVTSPLGLSGQRQLQLLQDTIFRRYSDAKLNPETAERTQLHWHNAKDQQSWLVIPRSFAVSRTAARSTEYFYSIELLAVDRAEWYLETEAAHERGIFDPRTVVSKAKSLRSKINAVRGAIAEIRGAINAVTDAVRNTINTVKSLGTIIDEALSVVSAVESFIEGVTDFIQMPFQMVSQLVSALDQITDALENAVIFLSAGIPAAVIQSMVDIRRGVEGLSLFGEDFQRSLNSKLDQVSANARTLVTAEQAAAVPPPQTFTQVEAQGTGPGPGSALADQARGRTSVPPPPTTTRQYNIGQGDTIFTVAQRLLGDSSRYREIAALNGLRPPYISVAGVPGTLRPGEKISIPVDDAGSSAVGTLPIIVGATVDSPEHDRLFGRDFRLDQVEVDSAAAARDPTFDLVLTGDQQDFKLVSGLDNLKQGMRTRLTTERDTSALFPTLGYLPTVGGPRGLVSDEIMRLRLAEAVRADLRIAEVLGVELRSPTPDQLDVEMDAVVYGLDQKIRIEPKLPR
jgi:hypothetical protein